VPSRFSLESGNGNGKPDAKPPGLSKDAN
jgi:hypothetical protein